MDQSQITNHRLDGEAVLGKLGIEAEEFAKDANDLAPGFGDFLVEAAFGTILRRPELDLRTREIATIGILTATGHAPDQLKTHIRAAMYAGVAKAEIVEVIVQSCLYSGIPATLNALALARVVFATAPPDQGLRPP